MAAGDSRQGVFSWVSQAATSSQDMSGSYSLTPAYAERGLTCESMIFGGSFGGTSSPFHGVFSLVGAGVFGEPQAFSVEYQSGQLNAAFKEQ